MSVFADELERGSREARVVLRRFAPHVVHDVVQMSLTEPPFMGEGAFPCDERQRALIAQVIEEEALKLYYEGELPALLRAVERVNAGDARSRVFHRAYAVIQALIELEHGNFRSLVSAWRSIGWIACEYRVREPLLVIAGSTFYSEGVRERLQAHFVGTGMVGGWHANSGLERLDCMETLTLGSPYGSVDIPQEIGLGLRKARGRYVTPEEAMAGTTRARRVR